jgi:predicted nucleic acid-binding protein
VSSLFRVGITRDFLKPDGTLGFGDIGLAALAANTRVSYEFLPEYSPEIPAEVADRYEALLTRSRGVTMVDLTRDHLKAAAHLRATSTVRTPDAVQLAVALTSRCVAFVTNDRRLPAVPGLRIVDLAAR